MECEAVRERLPWLLNRSLQPDERAAVESHLAGCPGCRAELAETRRAAGLFDTHLPPSTLVDLAWDRPLVAFDAGTVRRHLDGCASCADELELLRESRRTAESDQAPFRLAPSVMRPLALAASLVLAFAVGGRLERARFERDSGGPRRELGELSARLATAAAEADRLRAAEGELRRRLDALGTPMANLPVVELLPGRGDQRSAAAAGGGNVVVVPRGAAYVALVLSTEARRRGPLAVELRASSGDVLWRAEGLLPGPLGAYTLGVPAERLPEGTASLVILGEKAGTRPLEVFELQVRRQP